MLSFPTSSERPGTASLDLANVLVVHGDLTSRLALQTILNAGGYSVDAAATPAEALCRLDENAYELVLCDADIGSADDGRKVLAYARVKEYRPATALITGTRVEPPVRSLQDRIAIHTEDIPMLLGKVADLIGLRASRRYPRNWRTA